MDSSLLVNVPSLLLLHTAQLGLNLVLLSFLCLFLPPPAINRLSVKQTGSGATVRRGGTSAALCPANRHREPEHKHISTSWTRVVCELTLTRSSEHTARGEECTKHVVIIVSCHASTFYISEWDLYVYQFLIILSSNIKPTQNNHIITLLLLFWFDSTFMASLGYHMLHEYDLKVPITWHTTLVMLCLFDRYL